MQRGVKRLGVVLLGFLGLAGAGSGAGWVAHQQVRAVDLPYDAGWRPALPSISIPTARLFTQFRARAKEAPAPRTPAELAFERAQNEQNSCAGYDGKWRCPKVTRKPKLGALFGASGPALPAVYTVTEWDWDPSNSSTEASNLNSCTSESAPCADLTTIFQRLGTYAPRWRQDVLLRQMSAVTSAADILYMNALIENGAVVQYTCAPTVLCSGTVSGLTARNTATGQRWQMPLCGTPAKDQLIVNSTHVSHAWVDSIVSGSTVIVSDPIEPITVPWDGDDYPQVAWSNGDQYTVEKLCAAYVGELQPIVVGGTSSTISGFYMSNIDVQTPPPNAYSSVVVGMGAVYVNESIFDIGVTPTFTSTLLGNSSAVFNSVAEAPITTTTNMGDTNQFGWKGGILRQTFGTTVSAFIEDGTYIEGTIYMTGGGYLRDAYIGSGAFVVPMNGLFGVVFGTGGSAGLWGPGNLDVFPGATIIPLDGAVEQMQYLTGTIYLNNQTKGCTMANSSSPALTCGVSLTPTQIDSVGMVFSPVGAAILGASTPF